MTQNQISYAKLKEDQRHNLATEGLGTQTLEETRRHNVVGEGETGRHNVATEGINWYTAQGQVAANAAQSNYYNEQAKYVGPQFEIKEKDVNSQIGQRVTQALQRGVELAIKQQDADTRSSALEAEMERFFSEFGLKEKQWRTNRWLAIAQTVHNFTGSLDDVASLVGKVLKYVSQTVTTLPIPDYLK